MIRWQAKPLQEMSAIELHAMYQLRVAVFVVEQQCVYQDVDDKDLKSVHVVGFKGDTAVACARIVQAGVSYAEVSIGRVATHLSYRRTGLGKKLMEVVLMEIEERLGKVPIRISAQTYLVGFYVSFGFQTVGEEYLEDDMPHIEMLREVI
ncbi:MAG: GNAT family N-acetyltransferase [Chitinophagales bacterium]|nr:GNAT family N-acetyltransferase [Chitinophagales bacterium]